MADFYPPQIQNADVLGSYIRGQAASQQQQMFPVQLQAAQQENSYRGLQMDQLRMALKNQQMYQDYAKGLLSGQQGGAQSNAGAPTGGTQNGPQAAVGQSSSFDGSVSGMEPQTLQALAVLRGDDPLKTAQGVQEYQVKQRQIQVQGPMALAESVSTSPQADVIIKNNPSLQKQWIDLAPQLGLDPFKDLTPENARKVAIFGYNQLAGSAGLPPKPMPAQVQNINGPNGELLQKDPLTGKLSQVRGEETLQKVIDPQTGQPKLVPASQAAGMKPYNENEFLAGKFTPQMSSLMASLAERGVSLPTGMRSQAQQIALYGGLIDHNPGKSPEEIADLVKSGKVSLTGELREISTAGNIAGKVSYAENELRQSIPLALEASGNVPRGKFIPMNKLLQMANTSISDPDLLDLKIKTQSVLNAYDMLAARGGTDVGKREAQHALLTGAQSPEAYERALKAFTQEANVAKKAGKLSMQPNSDQSPQTDTKILNGKTYEQYAPGKWREQ